MPRAVDKPALRALWALLAAAAMPLAGVAAHASPQLAPAAPASGPVEVRIANFTFQRPTVTVKPGTTVVWINDDDIPHTVVAIGKSFRSKVLDTGDRFSFTFAKPGEFDYFCSLHPHMTGKVIVRA
jgi:plastocyanin